MHSKAVEAAVNDQIRDEFYSAHLYLSMSAFFESQSLGGFATWMRMQYEEEIMHAVKLYDFLLDNDGKVELQAIDQPPSGFGTPLEIMKQALEHEREVSRSITALYELALEERDYPTQILLQWFISEQTEEEKMVGDIVAQLEMIGSDGSALLIMDGQLGSRRTQAADA
ncbi:MAG: ferritin [Gemmatimonadales bacterium]